MPSPHSQGCREDPNEIQHLKMLFKSVPRKKELIVIIIFLLLLSPSSSFTPNGQLDLCLREMVLNKKGLCLMNMSAMEMEVFVTSIRREERVSCLLLDHRCGMFRWEGTSEPPCPAHSSPRTQSPPQTLVIGGDADKSSWVLSACCAPACLLSVLCALSQKCSEQHQEIRVHKCLHLTHDKTVS